MSVEGEFLKHYTNSNAWADSYWLGHRAVKIPMDFWVYQEILWETRPTVLIETGSFIGGSALFFATIFDLMDLYVPGPEAAARSVGRVDTGRIISIDKDPYPAQQPVHPRIRFVVGDAASDVVAAEIIAAVAGDARVMVSLDSGHDYEQVSRELALYGPLVTPGCYFVVEDTAVIPEARRAAQEYVAASGGGFVVDKSREKHLITFNPDGWLRRL